MSAAWQPIPSDAPRILIGEDQAYVSEALRLLLKGEGFLTEHADSPAGVLAAAAAHRFDMVLVDLNYSRDTTSGREGLELVDRLQELDRSLPVVVMTAWGSIDLAVEAMHRGARDFIQKPWANERLVEVIRAQVRDGKTERKRQFDAEQESSEARRIQVGLLPRQLPALPGYELASAWQPARQVGGDYFDVIALAPDRVALCIADVAGKGMPAALLMANLQAAVHATAASEESPAAVCRKVDALVRRNLPEDRFITFFFAMLDAASHTVTYCNAGHNPPVLLHEDTSFVLATGGPVLGVTESPVFLQGRLQMQPGDRLILFTDGVTEAGNSQGEMFSEWRLQRVLREAYGRGAQAIKSDVMLALSEFAGTNWEDDATLLVVRRA